jgi:ubiquinone/menaquinone biosynthesis C-methylase UbiE
MLHHLRGAEKLKTLTEIHRVLKPGGRLELVDFAVRNGAGQSRLQRWLHSDHRVEHNSESHVLALMAESGFTHARVVERARVLLGPIAYYRAPR